LYMRGGTGELLGMLPGPAFPKKPMKIGSSGVTMDELNIFSSKYNQFSGGDNNSSISTWSGCCNWIERSSCLSDLEITCLSTHICYLEGVSDKIASLLIRLAVWMLPGTSRAVNCAGWKQWNLRILVLIACEGCTVPVRGLICVSVKHKKLMIIRLSAAAMGGLKIFRIKR
ncbi:hypothetical protein C5167_044496, partial [Papaver somniferum]